MQKLLKTGSVLTAVGFLMTAFAGRALLDPDPDVIRADIGSGMGFGFGQVIGGVGVACLVTAFAGLIFQAASRPRPGPS